MFFGILEIYAREFKTDDNWKLIVKLSYLKQKLQIYHNKTLLKYLQSLGNLSSISGQSLGNLSSISGQSLGNLSKSSINLGKWNIEIKDEYITIYIPKFKGLMDESTLKKLRAKEKSFRNDSGTIPKSDTTDADAEEDVEADKEIPKGTDGKKAVPSKDLISLGAIPKIKEEIQKVGKELYDNNIFPKVFAFINKMLKDQKSERAILHSLTRCYAKAMNKDGFKKDGGPWAYCTRIMQIENGNFNEAEYQKTAKKSD